MKKFTLVFVLLTITATFAALYFILVTTKNLSVKQIPPDMATESTPKPGQTGPDLGPSVYTDYTKDEYNKALEEKRVLVLYFTANWCPICKDQEPANELVFDSLNKAGAVGLRVHILDSQTTAETEALAKKFDVVYQHTFVILDSKGAVYYKYTGPLEEESLKQTILQAVMDNNKMGDDASASGDLDTR